MSTTIDLPAESYTVVSVVSPEVQALVDALPIMRNGKPRRFRLHCECFEWTFNRVQREAKRLGNRFVDRGHLLGKVERLADALWHHQNPAILRKARAA